ncbi:restriction endonuclease subunit S [Microvirga terrae]|uniref:Restriction endonuclease subunit S n=1 Tax=Microvirga terrae TaxID=2740529 RepID=A0ABY5RNP8_9HYPH|nr:restriction endonuclease subunit S [Microvirga terrae]UVF18855.1 restriction endonuclease subunit S [Microvirga terrae]
MAGNPTRTVEELQAEGVIFVEDGNHGEYRPLPHEFVPSGMAFIRAADLKDGNVMFSTCEHINDAAAARVRKGIGAPNDIILSHKGTVGKIARVGQNPPAFVCSPQTTVWRSLDPNKLDRAYLYAFMRSSEFAKQLYKVQGETDMAPYVSLTAQRRFSIPLPHIDTQRSIGEITSTLDNKIELNQRMAETLEEIARALFKSWFVDFDPVRAKAEGRPTGLPDDIAALFPSCFGDDGLPEGWSTAPFGELFEVRSGNTPSTDKPEYWGEEHSWATPRDLSRLSSPILLATERQLSKAGLEQSNSGLLPPRSILLSTRAPIGYLAFAVVPVAINQGMAGIVAKKWSTSYAWLWCEQNVDMFISVAGGSTFPEISKGTLRSLPMLAPPNDIIEAFSGRADELVSRIINLAKESQTLGELRDILLPKLIFGELSIQSSAEAGVAA